MRAATDHLATGLAVVLIALAAFASVASAAGTVPRTFWGVVPQETPTVEHFQRLKRGGIGSVRVPVPWSAIQTVAGGKPDWSGLDEAMKGAATAGLDVLPFIYGAPPWAVATSATIPSRPPDTLPVKNATQRAAWTSFLTLAVQRYGPAGTFWAENPTVPFDPITSWQIWNEENFFYFVAKPNPADYGQLVKISSNAIKAVDPTARIVLGGLFARPIQAQSKTKPRKAFFATEFLEQMYRTTPGIKSKFDAVALHPYTGVYTSLTPEIEEVRASLRKSKDPTVPLWITELGWSSDLPGGPSDGFDKGPTGQAKQLTGAFTLLRENRVKWHIERAYWFSVDNQPNVCNFCNGSGLFGPGFVPKKSWFAYVKLTGGNPN